MGRIDPTVHVKEMDGWDSDPADWSARLNTPTKSYAKLVLTNNKICFLIMNETN